MNRRELFAGIVGAGSACATVKIVRHSALGKTEHLASLIYVASATPPCLTPREKAEGVPHSDAGVRARVSTLREPMRVQVGPNGKPNETLSAWHVETMDNGHRRVYLSDGGFHSYAVDAHVEILPDDGEPQCRVFIARGARSYGGAQNAARRPLGPPVIFDEIDRYDRG